MTNDYEANGAAFAVPNWVRSADDDDERQKWFFDPPGDGAPLSLAIRYPARHAHFQNEHQAPRGLCAAARGAQNDSNAWYYFLLLSDIEDAFCVFLRARPTFRYGEHRNLPSMLDAYGYPTFCAANMEEDRKGLFTDGFLGEGRVHLYSRSYDFPCYSTCAEGISGSSKLCVNVKTQPVCQNFGYLSFY